MKKIIGIILIISIMLTSCGKNAEEYEQIELKTVFEESENNFARSRKKYEDKNVNFFGRIISIDKKSFIINSTENKYAKCHIYNKEIKDTVYELNKNDFVNIYGKISKIEDGNIEVKVYNIEKAERFIYNNDFYFGMSAEEVKEKETNWLYESKSSAKRLVYEPKEDYNDQFGYKPDLLHYYFDSDGLYKITLIFFIREEIEYEQIKEKLKYDSTAVTANIRYEEEIIFKQAEIDFLDTTA